MSQPETRDRGPTVDGTEMKPIKLHDDNDEEAKIDGDDAGASLNTDEPGEFRSVMAASAGPNTQKFMTNYIKTAKYSLITFIPKNLFEQFSKVINIYFLAIAILQLFPAISPISPFTSIAPLVFVLTVSAIKEAIEDWQRHRSDIEVNARETEVIRDSTVHTVAWRDVKVGDILKIKDSQYFPADMILLNSSNEKGVCYIETMNLDGETNLKIRQALEDTWVYTTPSEITTMCEAQVDCELPNSNLYQFQGKMSISGAPAVPLETNQVLLRGAKLCNTAWIYGIVVYTGNDTKLMLNSTDPPSKRTNLDRSVNRQVFMIFAFQFALAALGAVMAAIWLNQNKDKHYYLDLTMSTGRVLLYRFCTFVILFNTMVPISLIVSIEVVKVIQAYFINSDLLMYHPETDTPAKARTSNLNEELGQVEYIFSDKTGTLTQNQMDFQACSIGGVVYGKHVDDDNGGTTSLRKRQVASPTSPVPSTGGNPRDSPAPVIKDPEVPNPGPTKRESDAVRTAVPAGVGRATVAESMLKRRGSIITNMTGDIATSRPRSFTGPYNPTVSFKDKRFERHKVDTAPGGHAQTIKDFLTLLAVCHTVVPEIPEDEPDEIIYQAESPDESALVLAAKELGYKFFKRGTDTITITTPDGTVEEYVVLNKIDFTSSRKRMSVIVKCPDGRIRLFCKGADNVIMERLAPGSPWVDETQVHLQLFASDGLRTLCIGVTDLDKAEYDKWAKINYEATIALSEREEKLAAAAELIECNMTLLGATAIEDKLQDGVPETIFTLKQGGIKIWVLTGDKQETAINIGHSCRLLNKDMVVVVVNAESSTDCSNQLDQGLKTVANLIKEKGDSEEEKDIALVIDGLSLGFALTDEMQPKLLKFACHCKAVICCRVSPLQKALVVRMVKQHLKTITLSIGDGANDVSMIQAAHLGIGISGNEGMQAAMSSDYSVAQFRYLQTLLLVHGRWSYQRIAIIILYSFYKNMAFSFSQFLFAWYSGFSGQTLYDSFYLAIYNVSSTALPIMAVALFDQDVSRSMSYTYPELYTHGQQNKSFNTMLFFRWLLNGILHSVVLFYLPIWIVGEQNLPDGSEFGLWTLGTICYTCVLIVVNLKVALETRYWTLINHFCVVITLVFWFVFMLIYHSLADSNGTPVAFDTYFVFYQLAGFPTFWAALLIVPVVTLLPDFIIKAFNRNYRPKSHHILQEIQKFQLPGRPIIDDPNVFETDSDGESGDSDSVGGGDVDNQSDAGLLENPIMSTV